MKSGKSCTILDYLNNLEERRFLWRCDVENLLLRWIWWSLFDQSAFTQSIASYLFFFHFEVKSCVYGCTDYTCFCKFLWGKWKQIKPIMILILMTVNYMAIERKSQRLDIYLWFKIIKKENHTLMVSPIFFLWSITVNYVKFVFK